MFKKKEIVNLLNKLNICKSTLYVVDDYLIVLSSETHYLYNISNKINPALLSTFSLSKNKDDGYSLLGLICKKAYFRIGYTYIEVIDFLDEAQPVNLGIVPFVSIGPRCEFYGSHYLITNSRMPMIYDVSTPSTPKTVFEFEEEISDFILIKTYLVCAILNNGVKVYDITEPSKPHMVYSLNLNAVKLTTKDHEVFVVQGFDDILYVVDISNINNIRITTDIKISGPIAANSLICANNYLYVRYMLNTYADTTEVFNISNVKAPKRIFRFKSANTPLYACNDKLLVLMGIKNWDGISTMSNYNTNIYEFFSVRSDKTIHLGNIDLEGIYFSSIVLSDCVVYISRPDAIYIYKTLTT